jgi:hypothetical protein
VVPKYVAIQCEVDGASVINNQSDSGATVISHPSLKGVVVG